MATLLYAVESQPEMVADVWSMNVPLQYVFWFAGGPHNTSEGRQVGAAFAAHSSTSLANTRIHPRPRTDEMLLYTGVQGCSCAPHVRPVKRTDR